MIRILVPKIETDETCISLGSPQVRIAERDLLMSMIVVNVIVVNV